jgi:CMP-N-acetylneuraminic acid synthetase
VSKTKNHPYSSFWKDNKILKPFTKNFQKYTLRQSHSDLYYPTGMIYTFWSKTLKKYDSIYGPKIIPLIIKEPELIIDIDEPFDFFISEMIIKYWKNYQKNF